MVSLNIRCDWDNLENLAEIDCLLPTNALDVNFI
jgi:hypothetical protein